MLDEFRVVIITKRVRSEFVMWSISWWVVAVLAEALENGSEIKV